MKNLGNNIAVDPKIAVIRITNFLKKVSSKTELFNPT